MSVVEMLIKMFLFIETFLTEPTLPFIYIYMRLMVFLISVYIIIRVKPTPFWDMIFFFLHERHQILQQESFIKRRHTISYIILMQVGDIVESRETLIWLYSSTSWMIFQATLLLSLEQCIWWLPSCSCCSVLNSDIIY